MPIAARILIIGGLANLLLGFVTGAFLGIVRGRQAEAPKYLRLAHTGALMWAPILFGLVVVLPLSDLADGTETAAAALMVGASVLLNTKDLWHWGRGTTDEFAEKPLALYLGHLMSFAYLASLVLFMFGAVRGLLS